MSVKVDIFIQDVVGLLDSGFEKIKVYRSARRSTDYSEITSPTTRITLDESTPRYTYYDVFGNVDLWYKWSFCASAGTPESSLSDPCRGTISGSSYYRGGQYPPEILLTIPETDMVGRIREYIGDFKEVNRDYLSSTTSYDNVSVDGRTVELDNPKGWPLSITVNSTSFNTMVDPIVNGYQFVTFSGTVIDKVDDSIDIWYEHFRFSDREILDAYNRVELPAGTSVYTVTPEMFEVATAIKLLEAELRNFLSTSSSKVAIFEEISIDPTGGMSSRQKDLDTLRVKLKALIGDATANNPFIYGVRID